MVDICCCSSIAPLVKFIRVKPRPTADISREITGKLLAFVIHANERQKRTVAPIGKLAGLPIRHHVLHSLHTNRREPFLKTDCHFSMAAAFIGLLVRAIVAHGQLTAHGGLVVAMVITDGHDTVALPDIGGHFSASAMLRTRHPNALPAPTMPAYGCTSKRYMVKQSKSAVVGFFAEIC
ncbi:hypothetical protein AFE_1123 [Acidithiobacillus ferrooxidans ATCC 23270]|uniref:Uncharacterized protein n=1 Tax=Acidithiobacillus ferrooxidans (strain ATCC 23270 / DSM 14882 / CIP 104768 / NCIMB 8455) TaxID=243159 RepID=B7J871_ACIF2|nr:hypothetical protein AFE_1123 [Acidithiobacillus ferrooxidans ATCC 23270]